MKKQRSTRTVALILAILVLLPALFYSGYEINALSTSEKLVADVYRRQLDVVLYSLNQYAWDVVNTWVSSLAVTWNESPADQGSRIFAPFLEKHAAVDVLFLADSSGQGVRMYPARPAAAPLSSITSVLTTEQEKIERLVRYSRQGYRKYESFMSGDSTSNARRVLILFVFQDRKGASLLGGIRIDETRFVNEVLSSRLAEAAADEFVLAVVRESNGARLFATDSIAMADVKQRRQLWLFPDLSVGIRLKGVTIDDVARSRFSRNLGLIVVLDLVLIAGVLFVYRSVRREMDFVRLKSDFVSNVSHELRTPLALIRMYAETLEMGRARSDKKKQEYYSTILKETERLTRLVNNLLSFSRMEAGRKPYTLTLTDLNKVVAGVLETFGPHLNKDGFTPLIALDPHLPAVHADGEAVQEAIINLLDNGAKYSDREKYLRVSTGTRGETVFISVEDHGIGIAREHFSRIFETFYRVSGGLVHTAKGSGLGLSIARHIMEAHRGSIEVDSVPGKGSTFTLIFPRDGADRKGRT